MWFNGMSEALCGLCIVCASYTEATKGHETLVSCHVGAENQTQDPRKSSSALNL